MNLEPDIEPLAFDIAFWMEGLMNPEYPIQEMGPLSIEISEKFRALAIIILLVKGNTDFFYHNLIRSGLARKTYLDRLHKENIDQDHHFASGRFQPLLDALAAGELKLARAIVLVSPNDWKKEQEYEDDYCYAQVIHQMIHEQWGGEGIRSILEQFAAYLNNESSARYDVCHALVMGELDEFEESFTTLINEREIEIEENKARFQMEDGNVIAERKIFVEGLALLRLAELRGLETQMDYKFCPSIARIPMQLSFPGE